MQLNGSAVYDKSIFPPVAVIKGLYGSFKTGSQRIYRAKGGIGGKGVIYVIGGMGMGINMKAA